MPEVSFRVVDNYVEQVVDQVRNFFYFENRDYHRMEEILIGCLHGTDIPHEKLKLMAQDILLGRAKLVSNPDGTHSYVEDNNPTFAFEYINKLQNEIAEMKKELDDSKNKYQDLFDSIASESIECTEYEDNRNLLIDHCRLFDGVSEAKRSYRSSIAIQPTLPTTDRQVDFVDDFIQELQYDDSYGWLSPTGEWYPVDFAEHTEWAVKYIDEHNLYHDFMEWAKTSERSSAHQGDYLVYGKGWILMHNPMQGHAFPTHDDNRNMTKRQKEFLFDYYTKRGLDEKAAKFIVD